MTHLEEMIGKAIPSCGLKALPHIDSRLKTLLTKFRAICEMLNNSGFKWDDERKMISVEREIYNEYCKHHSNAKNLYGVSFPHFHEMVEIYGNDYATGKNVETIQDALQNMEKEGDMATNTDTIDDTDGEGTQSAAESAPPFKKSKKEKTPKRKEREKVAEQLANPDLACLQSFMENMNVHLSTMANAWSRAEEREQEMADKSNKVVDELLQLEGLTIPQALEAATILTAQPNKLNVFYQCPTSLKKQYVLSLLLGASGSS